MNDSCIAELFSQCAERRAFFMGADFFGDWKNQYFNFLMAKRARATQRPAMASLSIIFPIASIFYSPCAKALFVALYGGQRENTRTRNE
jgi:hypothetical protein